MTNPVREEPMEAFNYLTVVTSIILGLGLSNLLVACAWLIQGKAGQPVPFEYVVWLVLLFALYITYWWAFWDYRGQVRWTLLSFFIMLAGPTGLFVITSLVIPDTTSQSFDPTAHYLGVRRLLFGGWAVLQVWGIILAPLLKDGFKWSSFLNRYKYAQYLLLSTFLWGMYYPQNGQESPIVDLGVPIVLAVVLTYMLGAHRWILR
ncbi:MAG TPA: hypothetical protein VJS20_03795 [Gemmatimonadales bacterium]|nr:hypothetical protein [Gemmatimonadales bacterium]